MKQTSAPLTFQSLKIAAGILTSFDLAVTILVSDIGLFFNFQATSKDSTIKISHFLEDLILLGHFFSNFSNVEVIFNEFINAAELNVLIH